MLISDLGFLELVDESRVVEGGETIQVFSINTTALALVVRNPSPGTSIYTNLSNSSNSVINNDEAYTNSTSKIEFGTIAAGGTEFSKLI